MAKDVYRARESAANKRKKRRAAAAAPPKEKRERPGQQRRERGGRGPGGPSPWLIVGLVLVAGAIVGLLLWALVFREPVEVPPVPVAPTTSQSRELDLGPVSAESEPEPEPEPEPDPEPEQEATPDFSFTEDELAMLDGMLGEWAEAVTADLSAADSGESDDKDEAASSGASSTKLTAETYGHNVSVFFMDIDSGLSYVYNGEHRFLIASLNKAPYAVYLYTLVEQGIASFDETFTVTAEMMASVQENTGRLKEEELPREYTLEELVYEMIRYSDTGALKVLLSRYGADGYKEWADGLGLHFPEDIRSVTNSRITALDAGVYLQVMYEYFENGEYGAQLQEHFLNTRNAMIRSAGGAVARKYGWDVESYHDMAVVYTERPYLLAILTDKSMGTWGEAAKFAEIAGVFEGLMNEKYAAFEAEQG